MARRQTDDLLISFTPKTELQASAIEVYNINDITFFVGPAGTGKTHLAVAAAISSLSIAGKPKSKMHRIIVTRPIVEAGESLGHLPGEVMEKVHPYMRPVYDCVNKLVRNADKIMDSFFEVSPLAYMRGTTFDNCVAILDEAQNCTLFQMKMFLSRLGADAKLIITGDPDQTDIGSKSALSSVLSKLHGLAGIGIVRFNDTHIVRHPLVGQILAKLAAK